MHEDIVRNITGHFNVASGSQPGDFSGVFTIQQQGANRGAGSWPNSIVTLNASRTIPTGCFTSPRAFGLLACTYLGS